MKNLSSRYVLLGLTSLLCLVLLIFRIYISENTNYSFLVWNLILAWIPLYFSQKLNTGLQENKRWFTFSLFISWLVFFPNAPYIITDLIHLKPKTGIPLWFDLILIISFAWNGLLIGFVSLIEIHHVFLIRFSEKKCWIIIASILLLSGYGIYLGRFERLNSWNIVTHPIRLISRMISNLQNHDTLLSTIGVTFSFGIFLLISYATIYFLSSQQLIKKR